MTNNTSQTNSSGNVYLEVVDLRIDHVEDKDDADATRKEFLNLGDRHERGSQPNIGSPL